MTLSVTIVTPSLNQGPFIERAVRSVIAQNVPDLEYVVVDGGSTDETLDVIRRFEDRLRWTSEPDRGQAHAVNKGIAATDGEVIGWLNSDDVYYPGSIRSAVDLLAARPELDVVYGDGEFVDVGGAPVEPYYTEAWDLERFTSMCFVCQPTAFFRRRVVERHGLLDERLHYCLDYEFWLRLGLGGAAFAYLPRLQAGYRVYPGTKSVGSRVALHTEINSMLGEKLGRTPEAWLINYGQAAAAARIDAAEHSTRFAVGALLFAWYAAVRWNRRLSPGLILHTSRTVGRAIRHRRPPRPFATRSD